MDARIFGTFIARCRRQKCLTQADVAEKIKCH